MYTLIYGAAGFQNIFSDFILYEVLQNTLVFTVGSLALQLPLGLLIAILLNQEFPGKKVLGALIIIPMMVPSVVNAAMFQLIAASQEYGLINSFLTLIGLPPVNWIGRPDTAMLTLIFANSWMFTPYVALIYLGALSGLPKEIYEAAVIDGASVLQRFFRITLPLLKTATGVIILLRLLQLVMFFDLPYLITSGGPGYATTSIVQYAYITAFVGGDFGYAFTIASLIFFILMGIAAVFFKYTKSWWRGY
ncbi:MAG: sugar ABC transporter permease [Thaumarchaeota archaeon]|nr:sugar ABC transporter permease [Nitrososphaerota archaeon]